MTPDMLVTLIILGFVWAVLLVVSWLIVIAWLWVEGRGERRDAADRNQAHRR